MVVRNGSATKIADTWTDLSDGSIDNAITVTDTNAVVGGMGGDCDGQNVAWTGIESDNMSVDHCETWDSNAMAEVGRAGTVKQSNGGWTDACLVTCDRSARLYCFEQPT